VLDTRASLVDFALGTFRDGCVAETAAALCAHEAALRARDPVVRGVLDAIADDEQRHAELAWAAVAWAVRSGGAAVVRALRAELSLLPATSSPLEDGELAPYGRLGADAERTVLERVVESVVRPCAGALFA
jgi:hypothetical protein